MPKTIRISNRAPLWVAPLLGGLLWAWAIGPAVAADRKLAFPMRGVVAEVLVTAGQTVTAGAALARLDDTVPKARKAAADAALKLADLVLAQADAEMQRMQALYDNLSASGEAVEKAKMAKAKASAEQARASARAQVRAWRLEHATLKAPFAGTVKRVIGYPGMVVNPQEKVQAVVVLSEAR